MPLPGIDSAALNWGADAWQDAEGEASVDPTTELSASVAKEIAADAAAISHTAIRATLRFLGQTYTSGSQVINVLDYDSVWGSATNVAPTVVQTSVGYYVITWPANVTDELGNSHITNIRFPMAPTVHGATAGWAHISSFTLNEIRIFAKTAAGADNSLNGDSIVVSWV
jgi:hypothetical protein